MRPGAPCRSRIPIPSTASSGGYSHVFAHNGEFDERLNRIPIGRFRPIGQTDSERAFCVLLARLEDLWLTAAGVPSLGQRIAIVSELACELRALGPANFLYADGDALFVHADARRHEPGGPLRPPGLHVLTRRCRAEHEDAPDQPVQVVSKERHVDEQEILLVASVPLTGESWTPMAAGELLVARRGRIEEYALSGA